MIVSRWLAASVVITLLFLSGCIVVPVRPVVVAPAHPYWHPYHGYYR